MDNFRLVILDYVMKSLDREPARKCLNDLIIMKQMNFLRTDPNYVVTDKHDIVGTHFLIYDTTDLYNPKVIFALRATYEDRCTQHNLRTPLQDLIPKLPLPLQQAYNEYHQEHPILVDCNSWCVELSYSQKKSGLRLSDIGYTMAFLHLARMGHNHMMGCTNEKYKAHRWLEHIGSFKKGYNFVHPVVPDPHMMILVEKFDEPFLKSVYQEYQPMFDNLYEIVPENIGYMDIKSTIQKEFNTRALKVA